MIKESCKHPSLLSAHMLAKSLNLASQTNSDLLQAWPFPEPRPLEASDSESSLRIPSLPREAEAYSMSQFGSRMLFDLLTRERFVITLGK